MKKIFSVYSRGKKYVFEIVFHKSSNVEDQQIESDFYIKYSENVHSGVHYEMEVVSTDLAELAHFGKVHIHTSLKTGKKCICWTGHLPTEEAAVLVTRMWCAGSVYTTDNGEDFGFLFEKHDIDVLDFKKMLDILGTEYHIYVLKNDVQ